MKKEIIDKLSQKQVYKLCIMSLACIIIIVLILSLISPEQLPSFFEIFKGY